MDTQKRHPASWPWLLAIVGGLALLWMCGLTGLLGTGAALWLRRGKSEPAAQAPALMFGAQPASLQKATGLVEIGGLDGEWTPAEAGASLQAGQRVRTGALSSAWLAFEDGSQANLGPDTQLSIDELSDGARQIVLTQWKGEGDYEVAPIDVEGRRYEVRTPSATGVAKGTRFQVQVSPDQRSRFSVVEGEVAVTAVEVTVLVEAGQVTLVNPDEPPGEPAFFVTGSGVVTQADETWIIGGQIFTSHPGTMIVGSPQVSDYVNVEGRLYADNTRVADLIILQRTAAADHFILSGEVQVIDETDWTIAGQTVTISDTTRMDPAIAVGDQARVEGLILEDGTLLAIRIQRQGAEGEQAFDFTGIVQEMNADAWLVSGATIAIDGETEITGDVAVGLLARVRGLIQTDGNWLARSIELSAQNAGAFEFSGEIENIDPWRVAGLEFETREWTEIEPGLNAGDAAHVKGQILPDGTWVAGEIDKLDPDFDSRIVLVGMVISIDPWVVAGFPLTIGADTTIVGNITVGMLVRVEVYLLANGEWQVVRIEPAAGLPWVPGCTNVTATVVTLNGSQLQLQGWPLLTLDEDVVVEGEILPNSIIQIQVCFTTEAEIHITTIIVIYQSEQALPPPTEDGKVLVCHKPDKKGGHTLSISSSAVPAHLGHGDRLGACGR